MAGHRARRAAASVVALLAVVIAGVVVLRARHSSTPPLPNKAMTEDYLPGVAADVYLRTSTTRAPVVVLIPGGGWRTADRTGLGPLADALAEHGMVAVNATYRAADDGVHFPVPVADVVCAIDFAVNQARRAGIAPGPVVVLGHSSGAHLAALAALAPVHFRDDCPYPPVQADGFVGLAGAYDVTALSDVAVDLFGVTQGSDPALWRDGDPAHWASSVPTMPALLAHGSGDDVVSQSITRAFAQTLEQAGHKVQLTIVDGASHASIYTPKVIAASVIAWVDALPGAAAN